LPAACAAWFNWSAACCSGLVEATLRLRQWLHRFARAALLGGLLRGGHVLLRQFAGLAAQFRQVLGLLAGGLLLALACLGQLLTDLILLRGGLLELGLGVGG
jgi:hypothetical protein